MSATPTIPCPTCGAVVARPTYDFPDNEWLPGVVVTCEGCGLLFKRPDGGTPAIAALYQRPDFAHHPYWSGEDAAAPSFGRILDLVARQRPGGGRLLDVGCGPGTFAALAAGRGFEVTGIDVNADLAALAAAAPSVRVVVGELAAVDLEPGSFDVITLIDLIEHVLDPLDLLARVRRLLAPDGVLVVYTPNHDGLVVRLARAMERWSGGRLGRPVTEIFDGPHVAFYGPTSLRRLLDRAGLDVVESSTSAYEPARSGQATGIAARALRLLELVGPVFGGRFRLLVAARAHPPAATLPRGAEAAPG